MIWILILISFSLSLILLKTFFDVRKERLIKSATIDSLLAVIGGSDNVPAASKQYFNFLRINLDEHDFNSVIDNIAYASNLILERDENGSLSLKSEKELIATFSNYAIDLHQDMEE